MKVKVIVNENTTDFENEVEEFIKDKNVRNIYYKTEQGSRYEYGLFYVAFIEYTFYDKELDV